MFLYLTLLFVGYLYLILKLLHKALKWKKLSTHRNQTSWHLLWK